MKQNILLIFVLIVFNITSLHANILLVPGEYPDLNSAAAVAGDGDSILIDSGEYTGTGIIAVLGQDNLTLCGVNGRAHLNASGVYISNGKAICVISGNNVLIENIEFSNADVPDNNGAGIRYEGSGSINIRNCYFHNNEMGILTGNLGTEEITIESCEFHDHGKSNNGFSHNIYIGRGLRFTMISSFSHDAYRGHNVKSRADENYILYNRIFDYNEHPDDFASSYLIDLPEGGLSYLIGNELHQSYKTENTTAVSYAKENTNGPLQTLYFINNTIVNDRNNGIALNIGGTPDGIVCNNIFDNFTTVLTGNFSGDFSNNEENVLFIDRDNYDYHLQEGSNGIDDGIDPGFGNGYDLTPYFEYRHPLSIITRPFDGLLDIGAFEFISSGITDIIINQISSFEFENYPNPFSNFTNIKYNIPVDCFVEINIYNINGQKIQTLIETNQIAGQYSIEFERSNLESGLYFYELKYNNVNIINKMIIVE